MQVGDIRDIKGWDMNKELIKGRGVVFKYDEDDKE